MECVTCVCVWLGAVWVEGGESMRELGLGFSNPVGTGGVLNACLCFGCGGAGCSCLKLSVAAVFSKKNRQLKEIK